jgi:hypothetical protein
MHIQGQFLSFLDTYSSRELYFSENSLGTGHKVFTRGCGGYFFGGGTKKNPEPLRGYEKNNRTSRGIPKS